MARKDYAQAVAEYQIALQSSAKDAQVLNKIGIAYQQLGELDKAERSYRKALSADKKFSSAANNLGNSRIPAQPLRQGHQALQAGAGPRPESVRRLQQSRLRLLRK